MLASAMHYALRHSHAEQFRWESGANTSAAWRVRRCSRVPACNRSTDDDEAQESDEYTRGATLGLGRDTGESAWETQMLLESSILRVYSMWQVIARNLVSNGLKDAT